MKIKYFSYLLGLCLLGGLYTFFIPESGFRLPIYYTPDGSIFSVQDPSYRPVDNKLLHINGKIPEVSPIIFSDKKTVSVAVDLGTKELHLIPNEFWGIISDFIYLIAASILFLLCSIWFYHNTRDIHLVNITFVLSTFCFLFVIVLVSHQLLFFWQISSLLLIPMLFNMGLRTTGRYVSNYVIIGEVTFILFLSLLIYIWQGDTETLQNLNIILAIAHSLVILFLLTLQLGRALKKTKDSIEKLKRWVLFFGSLTGIFLPLVFFLSSFFSWTAYPVFPYLAFTLLLFPISLVYGTYRLQLTPFQLIFSKSILVFLQGAFFAAVYGLVVLIPNALLTRQQKEHEWIVQAVFILILIFFLDPLKYFLSSRLGKGQLWSEASLEKSLQKMVSVIISHRRIQQAVDTLLEEAQNVLKIKKIDLLLSEDTFEGLGLRKNKIIRIPSANRFWRHLQEYEFIVTDYLTYGSGIREELFRFLFQNDYMLAIGVTGGSSRKFRFPLRKKKKDQENSDNMKVALLIGYRDKHTILKISEIRYLNEAARLVNVLIRNYAILLVEIEKRRRIRELQMAGQLQRRLPEIEKEKCEGVSCVHSSQPALSVSGDYFDVIPIKKHRIACLLGDVCGHGLGTGYLVSSLRSIVRSHLRSGASLAEAVQTVNLFFMERYKGDEFLTLAAVILDTRSRVLEYINAAHPSPWLLKAESQELTELKSFQPMIGLLPTALVSKKIKINAGDRLFFYSDGVTETFNSHNIPFTEKRLKDFIMQHRNQPIQDIIVSLKKQLADFRDSARLEDDTTMALLEFKGKDGFMSNLLNRLPLP